MLRLAHIVNPVVVPQSSDLYIAQPITFETMRLARSFAMQRTSDPIIVDLFATQYFDEERVPLPTCINRITDLHRNVSNVIDFKIKRKFAILADILNILHDNCNNADYYIYTNVDISLQPYFYNTVCNLISRGYDAFVINRRSISDRFECVEQIPLMYKEIGNSHKGYDCFVFKKEVFPSYELGLCCLGTPWVDRALLANLVSNSINFKEFGDEHLTFHIGNTRRWLGKEFSEYVNFNKGEFLSVFEKLESKNGVFDSTWRSYLIDEGEGNRQYPEFPDL